MLLVSTLVVVLALVLQVRADDRVVVAGLSDYPLPPTCMSYAWFGVKCPGCGLTRSFVHLAHGDWTDSFRSHRLGWLMFAAVLVQFPYRLISLASPNRPRLGTLFPRLFGYLLIGLLVGNWLLEMFARHFTA
jgi:hypothetical protein